MAPILERKLIIRGWILLGLLAHGLFISGIVDLPGPRLGTLANIVPKKLSLSDLYTIEGLAKLTQGVYVRASAS